MNSEASKYFNHLEHQFTEGLPSLTSRRIVVGSILVQFNFIGDYLVPVFFDVFRHIEILQMEGINTHSQLIINLWDKESTGIGVDDPPWRSEVPHHLGLIKSFTTDQYFTLQQPGSGAIYMFDKTRSTAYYHVLRKRDIPFWESDFPLRMVFHWFFKDTPLQPVHSAAVGTENGGVLLIGKGGSGKSTTTLSCLNSPLKIAGDDYVLLDSENHVAYSLFSLSKLTQSSIDLLQEHSLNKVIRQPEIEGKFRLSLFDQFPESLIKSIPIKAILLPTLGDYTSTKIVPTSQAQAMIELAPTTLFQLPGLREHAFMKMARFVRQVPAFNLQLSSDIKNLPVIIESFINQIAAKQ
jgi:hypothetical protein